MSSIHRPPRARRPHVEIPRPQRGAFGRWEAELSFPASGRRRAVEHRSVAVELATLYGIEWRTPWRLTPEWSPYRGACDATPFGRLDERRMVVTGPARTLARYLAALPRVLAGLESAATRAARTFGRWRRSLLATLSGALEYEDPDTLRVRARDFRTAVLRNLVACLRTPPAAAVSDPAQPLWEQADAVAAEVWADHPVDPWSVPADEVDAALARMAGVAGPVVVEEETPVRADQHDQEDAGEATTRQTGDDERQDDAPTVDAPAPVTLAAADRFTGRARCAVRRAAAVQLHRHGTIRDAPRSRPHRPHHPQPLHRTPRGRPPQALQSPVRCLRKAHP